MLVKEKVNYIEPLKSVIDVDLSHAMINQFDWT